MADLAELNAATDFRDRVALTHDLSRASKVLCPFYDDHSPSCHIYRDGFKGFACGAHGDHVDWLMQVEGRVVGAIKALEQHAAKVPSRPRATPSRRAPIGEPGFRPVSDEQLQAHYERAARLDRAPPSLEGRGSLDDLRALMVAELHGDALLAITGPTGEVLAFKRRHLKSGLRYSYLTAGHRTPAWCSPGFAATAKVLVIEGELNGMACYLARPQLGVMGTAGAAAPLHLGALRGKTIYIYADGDEAGQEARKRWAAEAYRVAGRVLLLEPWELDACIAGQQGRGALAELLA